MKIAFIGQKGIPAKLGGVEKYVEEVTARLSQKGHEVFVYVRPNYTDKTLKKYRGVNLINLPTISTKNLDAITHTFLATLHAIFQGYDIIHYNSIGPTSLAILARIFAIKSKIVSTFQCQDYFHKKWGYLAKKYLQFGEYITCHIPDATIVVSKSLQQYVRNKYKQKTYYIPNGAEIKNSSPEEERTIKQWDLSKDNYIFTASRLIRHKGIHYLIEAFKSLEDENLTNGKKLVIAGDGFHTQDYVNYLKELAGNRSSIIFTGAQSGQNLESLYSQAYLFVQPSESEGLSLALLEAMGRGKAVLVSNIIENIEAVENAGMTFQNKSTTDLKDKLAYLINQPEEVDQLGKKAQQRIAEIYDWKIIVEKIEQLYQELKTK